MSPLLASVGSVAGLSGQPPGVARRVPEVLAAAEDDVGLGALEELARDLALLRAVGDVRGVGRGRGVGDLRGRDEPGRLAGPPRVLEQRAHRLAGGVDADGAVERLHAGGERRRRGGRVGHRLLRVGRVGVDQAGVVEPVHHQLLARACCRSSTSRIRSRCAVPMPSPCSTITLRAFSLRPWRAASVHVGTIKLATDCAERAGAAVFAGI